MKLGGYTRKGGSPRIILVQMDCLETPNSCRSLSVADELGRGLTVLYLGVIECKVVLKEFGVTYFPPRFVLYVWKGGIVHSLQQPSGYRSTGP